ncbi:MAG: hypothetical protein GY702_26325 [Desulfobulbaceae bacterium]|nr:hypothetical protein [Desulfobulbaceae bacterium]
MNTDNLGQTSSGLQGIVECKDSGSQEFLEVWSGKSKDLNQQLLYQYFTI